MLKRIRIKKRYKSGEDKAWMKRLAEAVKEYYENKKKEKEDKEYGKI